MDLRTKVELALNRATALFTPKRILVYALALTTITWLIYFPINNLRTRGIAVTPVHPRGGDFIAFYTAAQIIRSHPEKLYDIPTQRAIQLQWLPQLPMDLHWHYVYPPFFALLLKPLGRLSYLHAYWTWVMVSFLLYVLSIWILASLLPSASSRLRDIFLIAVPAPAFFWCVMSGQTTALSLLLWTLAFYLIKRGKRLLSGMALGLLAYRFQFLIVLAPVFLLKRFWKVILGLSISSLVLVVVGGLAFSFQSYVDYLGAVRILSERIGEKLHPLPKYVSLYGFFRPLLPDSVAIGLTILVAVLLVRWLARMWQGRVVPEQPAFDLQFSMAMTVTLLVMYHSLVYDLLLLAIPALVMYQHRSLFPPSYKLLLALLYFAPYYSFVIAVKTGFNVTQPLLVLLSYEIYRAWEKQSLVKTVAGR